MTREVESIPSFSNLLREALGAALRPDAEGLLDMCDEQIVFEFPYAPAGAVSRLEGKTALADYLPKVGALIVFDDLRLLAVHRADEVGVFVVEFSCRGHGRDTGLPYAQIYISVIHVQDGLIVRYRDYWNPQVLLSAVGGEAALARALNGAEG